MRIILLLYELIVVSVGVVLAEPVYFKAVPEKYLLTNDMPVSVKMNYDIIGWDEKRFRIRPVTSNGKLKILKNNTAEWIEGNDNWLSMPYLVEKIIIKPLVVSATDTYIHFLIQDTFTSKIYETPKIHLWTNLAYSAYLQKLNEHINVFTLVK